jgi:hypothetical protein
MKTCPQCKRPIGGNGRFCFACRLPIGRSHKWHVVGCYVVHDDCANPSMRLLVRPQEEPGGGGSEQPHETGVDETTLNEHGQLT